MKKILSLVDLWFFSFAASIHLEKKIDAEFYAIFDVEDKAKKFFEEQKFINFKKKWFLRDSLSPSSNPDLEYLKAFEEKYSIDLWNIIFMERDFSDFNQYYKFSKNEILSILESECKFFENILDEINPDFVISFTTITHYQELFRQLCIKKGIKFLMLNSTKVGNRSMISEQSLKMEKLLPKNHNTTKKSLEELQEYIKKYNSYEVTKEFREKNITKNFWGRYKSLIKFLILKNSNKNQRYSRFGKTKFNVIKLKISSNIRRKYRNFFLNKNFLKSIDTEDSFVYFPLHVEPERTLLVDAPFFSNQIEVIRNLAKSIPINYKLLVKEHPVQRMYSWRKISFYKEIMKIPNVILIHPDVNPDEVLKKCSLVVSISSTAGMEALFLEKSVISFTENFYTHIPSVKIVTNFEELPDLISVALQEKASLNDLNRFIEEIENNTFVFNETKLASDFAYRFGLKGMIMDEYLEESKINSYLEDYHKDFEILSQEFKKKILSD